MKYPTLFKDIKNLFIYLKENKILGDFILGCICITLTVFGLLLFIYGIFTLNSIRVAGGVMSIVLGVLTSGIGGENEIQKEMDKYEPFDVVVYKPTGERGLVKRVTEDGVFVLFRIQSTAQLCKFEDLEKE